MTRDTHSCSTHPKVKKLRSPQAVDAISASIPDADWNDEIEEDVNIADLSALKIYSRDWTIETIHNQISQQNIDLNPKFQRRNAWTDDRRSKLIESLIIGLPVPEIVLAEHPVKQKSFIVIDGKQRLLTIAGFIDPTVNYWKKAQLGNLKLRPDLKGATYDRLQAGGGSEDDFRKFLNADIRCTVVSNVKSSDVLYDIFYRLNTGSVPLSTQELRQVLHKGDFADYLIEITNTLQPIHRVLGLNGPDARLRDAEIVLRFISLLLFAATYRGNLKLFLDDSMRVVTADWATFSTKVKACYKELNKAITLLTDVFGSNLVGRKYVDGDWESRFNRVLFEVEAFYFRLLPDGTITTRTKRKFLDGFKKLCDKNSDFRNSIEATTKTNERYETRFRLFQELINESFGVDLQTIPIRA